MKFSILKTTSNDYQFAVTTSVGHNLVPKISTLTQAMHLTLAELKSAVSNTSDFVTGELAAPISPEIELWGAGVTYLRSRDARKEESGVPDVYQRVYEADRPELFFKSSAVRARGTNAPVGIRFDSAASVPEPEVAIYINKHREIIGYAICNDMTARTIEGENPLYLSQAKIYIGSTAIGPDITPSWLAPSAAEMTIKAKIIRGTKIAWEAQTSLGSLNRTLEDLITYLFRCQDFPHGVILSTGTGIVPPLDISLEADDVVEIDVAGIGKLINTVEVIQERR
ncbi:MAG: fumarylacetoacetate hydrolase [Actinomycetales bacterium]|jgi:2-dehydro-3-deoxy-D-arabinonate dehydratase|nr:MAG: fumarylacetoacetate hydrolase [Actinomycetales bacterium]